MENLVPPLHVFNPKDNLSQSFGVSRAFYYKHFKMAGHQGLDIYVADGKMGFGTRVIAAHDGIVEKISYDVPHQTKGNGIYILDKSKKFSTVYWHLASFADIKIGQEVKQFDTIATLGNSGFVRPLPTKDCPHCGSHLHFAVRVHGKINDYKGFVDPLPLIWRTNYKLPFRFDRDLFFGSRGDSVSWLQTILRIEGFAEDYDPIGFYGTRTVRDVRKLQQKHNINPPLGYCGNLTRTYLRNTYLHQI